MKLPPLSSLLILANRACAIRAFEPQQPIELPDSLSSASSSSPLLKLHKSLVDISSITGNEHNVDQFLVSYLESKNFTVETQNTGPWPPSSDSKKPRYNILAYPGNNRQTKTLVSSHIDTVPPFWPYEKKGKEIWGRGSVDAKGSVATQIIAVEELLAAGKIGQGDVGLLFVVGEEVGGDGMKKANDLDLKWDTVIFGEPTELKLASGHKGIMSLDIKAKGKAGHSGYPELGRNANNMLIPALNAMLQLQLPYSEKYGNTTLNIGKMKGGVAGNVIAEDASAKIAIRIADGEPAAIEKLVLNALRMLGEELEVSFNAGYGPIYIDSDVKGFDVVTVNYGTDIPWLKGNHKRYLFGPGSILLAHSDHEHVSVSDLDEAVKGYKILIEHSLK